MRVLESESKARLAILGVLTLLFVMLVPPALSFGVDGEQSGAAIVAEPEAEATLPAEVPKEVPQSGVSQPDPEPVPPEKTPEKTSPVATPVVVAVKTGSISGRVTAPGDVSIGSFMITVWDDDYDWVAMAETKADGSYTISNLAPGTYRVEFDSVVWENVLPQWWSGRDSFESATPITVTAGSAVKGIDASLAKGGSIQGKITVPKGMTATSVVVDAYDDNNEWAGTGEVDSSGAYAIDRLPTGIYRVVFDGFFDVNVLPQWWSDSNPIGVDKFGSATPIAVKAGEVRSGVNISMVEAASISGAVKVPDGALLKDVRVSLYDSERMWIDEVNLSSKGTYRFIQLPAGDYRVSFDYVGTSNVLSQWWKKATDFESATPILLGTGQAQNNVDASLAKGGSISGKVTIPRGVDSGDLSVVVFNAGREWITHMQVKSDGTYRIHGLNPGTYKVMLQYLGSGNFLPAWWSGTTDFESARTITINGAHSDWKDVDLALAKGASITGKVVPPVERVLPEQDLGQILVYPASGDDQSVIAHAAVLDDGSFSVVALPTGSYKIRFLASPASPLGDTWWKSSASSSSAEVMMLSAGQAKTGVTITAPLTVFSKLKGSISGTVRSQVPFDLFQVRVNVYDAQQNQIGTLFAAEDGTYKIGGLPAGTYKVEFVYGGVENVADQWWGGATDFARAKSIALASGQAKKGIDATLAKGASISGVVRVPSGHDPQEVYVYAFDSQRKQVGISTVSEQGTYRISGLHEGDYRVFFDYLGEWGLVDRWWAAGTGFASATPITLTEGQAKKGVDAALSDESSIVGRVTMPAGADPSWIEVSVYDADQESVQSTWADADGDYRIGNLPAGSYRLRFSYRGPENVADQWWSGADGFEAALPLVLGSQEHRSGVDATLEPGAVISGNVLIPAGKASDVTVEVYDPAGRRVASGNAADDGTYAVVGLVADTYRVRFAYRGEENVADQWWSGADGFEAALPLVLGSQEHRTGVDATLEHGAVISGTILLPEGMTAEGLAIDAYAADGTLVKRALARRDGTYRIAGLPDGEYWLRSLAFVAYGCNAAECIRDERTITWWDSVIDREAATGIALERGQTLNGIDWDLRYLGDSGALPAIAGEVPTISGDPRVGQTLKADPGIWTEGAELTYRWMADGVAIVGEESPTLQLGPALAGKVITVTVTGSKSGYLSLSRTSAPVGPVVAAEKSPEEPSAKPDKELATTGAEGVLNLAVAALLLVAVGGTLVLRHRKPSSMACGRRA